MAKKKIDKDSFIYFLAMLWIYTSPKLKEFWRKFPIPRSLRGPLKVAIIYCGSFILLLLFLFLLAYILQFILDILILVIIGVDNTFKFFHIPLNLEKFELFSSKIGLRKFIGW